jgi:hypothetical protein
LDRQRRREQRNPNRLGFDQEQLDHFVGGLFGLIV